MVMIIMDKDSSLGHKLFLNELINQREIIKAISIPTNGASIMKLTVFITGSGLMELNPAWAIAAPAKPPINVCEELDGIPNHQVSKFQPIAATRPDIITGNVIKSYLTVLAIVLATP